jgi:hypothetical protein
VLIATEGMKLELDPLVVEVRDLVGRVHTVGTQAHEQLQELHNVVRTVTNWAERADHLVNEVGSAIEPPVLTATRTVNIVCAGMNGFVRVLMNGSNHNQ